MATLKTQELRHQSAGELTERLKDLKVKLYELRLQASIGNLEKPHLVQQNRREIAKVLSLLREKELENVPAKSQT